MLTLRSLSRTWATILVLAACDGNGGPTGPTGDDIRGTYSGQWIIRIVEVSTGLSVEIECPGNVTVANQTASTLSGTYALNAAADCESVNGTFEGTRSGGAITMALDPDPFSSFEEEIEECTVVTQDDELAGAIAGRNLSADGSITADCETQQGIGRFRFDIIFDGMRPA